MSERVAFTVSAFARGELKGGNRDVSLVHSHLLDPEVGDCSSSSPKPLHECKSSADFEKHLKATLQRWSSADQLLFYFSGHGEFRNGIYCLKAGPRNDDLVPFINILNILKISGVCHAILMVDACFSGATFKELIKGKKDSNSQVLQLSDLPDLPRGIVILASSGEKQQSEELQDGSGSVFTSLFCEALGSGLGGERTLDGLIYAGDIIRFVKKKLDHDPKYNKYRQRPRSLDLVALDGEERAKGERIWVAHNRSGVLSVKSFPFPSESPPEKVYSDQELKILYDTTARNRRPVSGATADKLDWGLVKQYAIKQNIDEAQMSDHIKLLSDLDLFAHFPVGNTTTLHKPAVLCFCRNPEHFIHQAKSIFIVGEVGSSDFVSKTIKGPLPRQFKELYNETIKNLGLYRQLERMV